MKGIRAYELMDYAKKSETSVYFKMYIEDEYKASGKILDAYFDMAEIPVIGKGFIILSDYVKRRQDANVTFDIIDENEYKICVFCDFVVRGRLAETPKEFLHDIENCSTCVNNVEYPPPHTCDICTSLDEKKYCMWELMDITKFLYQRRKDG